MSAKILAFDPNRTVPPRHYTPIALRGRILQMAAQPAEAAPRWAGVKTTMTVQHFLDVQAKWLAIPWKTPDSATCGMTKTESAMQ